MNGDVLAENRKLGQAAGAPSERDPGMPPPGSDCGTGSLMSFFHRCARNYFGLAFLIAGPTVAAFAADPGPASPRAPGWTGLTFTHSRMLGKLTVQIQLQSPAPVTDGLLTKVGAGLAGSSAAGEMNLMTVDLRVEGRLFIDEQYTEKIWFDAADGRAHRRLRWRRETDPWVKVYSWTEKGVRRQKLQPEGQQESKQDPMKWTQSTESFYPRPQGKTDPEAISDPMVLLYLLSVREPLKPGSAVEFPVFGKEEFHRLACRREESPPMKVSFKTRSSSGVVGINTTVKPVVYSIEAESSAPQDRRGETFSLLGLQKDIRICLDPATRLPIRVSGRNKTWGEMVLDLIDARLD